MPLLTKSRSDGLYIKKCDPYNMLLPHVMVTRTESVVYFPIELCVEDTLRYLDSKRAEGKRLTLFNVVLAALARTSQDYKKINRFIVGRRLYQHKDFSAAYVIKRKMSLDGEDSLAKISFSSDENLFECSAKMNGERQKVKRGDVEAVDKLITFFARLPRFLLRFTVSCVKTMDYYGMVPAVLIESLPFYSSVFASNLGSIGVDAPFHHLYELGTCSIFLTLGKVFDKAVLDENGQVKNKKYVYLRVTVDERMCDGFYLARALDRFKKYIVSPELLERSFDEARHSRHDGEETVAV